MKTLRIAVLAAVVLSVGIGGQLVYGQNDGEGTLSLGEAVQLAVERRNEILIREGLMSPKRVTAGELGVQSRESRGNMQITADAIEFDQNTGVIEAEGNVTVTTTREDGSTVTMRAERMTIEEAQ